MNKWSKIIVLIMLSVGLVGTIYAGINYVVENKSTGSDIIFKYDDSWTLIGSFNITNIVPCGLDYQNGYVYVLNWVTGFAHHVRRYSSIDGSGETISKTLRRQDGGAIRITIGGFAIDGNDMWVAAERDVSGTPAYLFKFSLSDAFSGSGNINASQEIETEGAGATIPTGLAIDETYLYVLHERERVKKKHFMRFPRSGGSRTISKTLKTGAGGDLNDGQGAQLTIESGTKYLWALDDKGSSCWVYKYAVNELFSGSGVYYAIAEYQLDSNNIQGTGLGYETTTPTPTATPTPTPTPTATPTPTPTPTPT
ncbi:MAG: hypothetical protein N2246_10430, partial [Candidatus Sumerlaeia bacterium]|nr:hypothetical protein [Candidatus Sumerlaeia bacterium]